MDAKDGHSGLEVVDLKLSGDHYYSTKNQKCVLKGTDLLNPSHNWTSRALDRGRRFTSRVHAFRKGMRPLDFPGKKKDYIYS